MLVLPLLGLGFFCGPILTMASEWQKRIPGGAVSVGSVTLAFGVSALTVFEGMEFKEAVHLSIHTGRSEQRYYYGSCLCLRRKLLIISSSVNIPFDIRYHNRVRKRQICLSCVSLVVSYFFFFFSTKLTRLLFQCPPSYGNIVPNSDLGRIFVAIYAIMVCNVAAGLLDQGRFYLESFCRRPVPAKELKGKQE